MSIALAGGFFTTSAAWKVQPYIYMDPFSLKPHFRPDWLSPKKKKNSQITKAREGVERREPSYAVDTNVNLFNCYGEPYGGFLKN